MGLIPTPEAKQRLNVLLQDPGDWMTSVNAAIALARTDSTAGYDVFVKALSSDADDDSPEAAQDRLLILRNTLKAVGDLATDFTPQQREKLKSLVTHLAEHDGEARIRVDAQVAAAALAAAG